MQKLSNPSLAGVVSKIGINAKGRDVVEKIDITKLVELSKNVSLAKENLNKAMKEYEECYISLTLDEEQRTIYRKAQNSSLIKLIEEIKSIPVMLRGLYKGDSLTNLICEHLAKIRDSIKDENVDWERNYDFVTCEMFLKYYQLSVFDLLLIAQTISSNDASYTARLKAIKRLENDPIQKSLDEIEKEYASRKSQFKRRGFSAQFIREMHEKYPVITSIKTIEKLVSELNKENEYIPR